MNKLHFIAGLPRSGSTLLAGILRQNPRFRAGMSSPVGAIFRAMQEVVSRKNEAALFLDETQKWRLLRGVFESYYGDEPEGVTFDTNRLWPTKLPQLACLFPDAKMICCVRDVSWIVDSIEKLIRANAFDLSGIFGYSAQGTVFDRVNGLVAPGGLVGFAINALREAYYSEHAGRLLLVSYETLTRYPGATLKIIYDFLGEDAFEHDFDNVEYEAQDFDLALGTPGLHTVKRKVEYVERATILPPELFARFANDAFWMRDAENTRHVPVVLCQDMQPRPRPVETMSEAAE